jgi:hypothetical protein
MFSHLDMTLVIEGEQKKNTQTFLSLGAKYYASGL